MHTRYRRPFSEIIIVGALYQSPFPLTLTLPDIVMAGRVQAKTGGTSGDGRLLVPVAARSVGFNSQTVLA